jgi:hypothetical protein
MKLPIRARKGNDVKTILQDIDALESRLIAQFRCASFPDCTGCPHDPDCFACAISRLREFALPYPGLRRWWYTRRGLEFSLWTEGYDRVLQMKLEESQLWVEQWKRPKDGIDYHLWEAFRSWWHGAEWLPYEAAETKQEELFDV